MRALLIGLMAALACKATTPASEPDAGTAFTPTRLDWTSVEAQGVFASRLAALGRREWVWVEAREPETLVVHLVPVDAFVDMNALNEVGEMLKSMLGPSKPDGWKPNIEIRIEPGGAQQQNVPANWWRGRRR